MSSVSFNGADAVTRGKWKTAYGSEGCYLPGVASSDPNYATILPRSAMTWTWTTTTSDVRALRKPAASDSAAACWFAASAFTIDINLADSASHRIALYFLDWDRQGRGQTIEVMDIASGSVLDSRTLTGFGEGQYLSWTLRGRVRFRITCTAGPNAVVSGLFFGGGIVTAAKFIQTDTRTQGSWNGVYGSQGYRIIGDSANDPAYAKLTTSGAQSWIWQQSSSDARALPGTQSTGRIAACWYTPTSLTLDVNFTDGAAHRLSLYFLDWDSAGRSQKVEVLDADTGAVLDTRTVSSFVGGQYLSWDLSGSIRFRLTRLSGANAVVSGIFFGAPVSNSASVITSRDGTERIISLARAWRSSTRMVR